MARSLNASVVTEIAKDSVKMCHLIYMGLSTAQYMTDAAFDIDYDGNTYQSSNYFMTMGSVDESSEVRVGSIGITLSGVGQSFTSAFLSYPYVGKQVIVYRAFLNDSGAIIGEPVVIYDGRIDGYDFNESEKDSTISVTVASHWSDFEKKAGRYTNSNSQELFFTGDKGFEFAAVSVKDLKWGRA
jgi:hypothetical protein